MKILCAMGDLLTHDQYCDKQKNLKYYNKQIRDKYHKMCIEIIQQDDVQEYVALGILDSCNYPYVLDDIS